MSADRSADAARLAALRAGSAASREQHLRGSLAKGAAARAGKRVDSLGIERPELAFPERCGLAAREVVGEAMAGGPRPADLMTLAAEAAALAESLAAEGCRMAPPERPIACRAGCSHCCHLSVLAAPAEVLRLAQHVRDRFSAAERAGLMAAPAPRPPP